MRLLAVSLLVGGVLGPVAPRYVDVPRFDALHEADEALAFFQENGFAVYAAANEEELARAWDLFWEFVEGFGTGINRADPATWGDARWPSTRTHTGLLTFFGWGQSEFLWHLRGLPRVRAAFAKLWGTEELLASFDGATALRFQDPSLFVSEDYWWHVDQNPRSQPSFDCVQGALQLTESLPELGGPVLIPGSHRLYPHFYEQRFGELLNIMNPNHLHFGVPAWDIAFQDQLASVAVQPRMLPGDLVVWNSTTLHCNFVGSDFGMPRGVNRTRRALGRLAGYVAMAPREKASEEVLRERMAAICQGATTTHWPHRFVRSEDHNAGMWHVLGESHQQRFRPPPPRGLTAEHLRLAGFAKEELAAMAVAEGERFRCDDLGNLRRY